MKITIVSYYFFPDQHVAAVRPQNWAAWLSDECEVSVVTRESETDLDSFFPFTIFRTKSYALRLIEWIKKNKISERFRSSNSTNSKDMSLGDGCLRNKPSGIFYSRMPSVHDLWFISCYFAIKKSNPDVVIATHGPYIGLIASYFYVKNNKKTKLWIDYRDFWTQTHLTSGVPFVKIFEKYIESKCRSIAAVLTTIGMQYSEKIANESGKNVFCVYNSPLIFKQDKYASTNKKISITYTGTIYPVARNPSPLFDIVKKWALHGLISPEKMSIEFASKYSHNLQELIRFYGLSDYVHYHGEISREESVKLQQNSSILLLLESSSLDAKGVLTGKVFEYLSTDKPILLVGPGPESELYQLLDKYNRLLTLESFQDIIENSRPLPTCTPVDFREISRRQLFGALSSLSQV